jgi:RNA polymerase sigma-70 factor (ECF subfamily)
MCDASVADDIVQETFLAVLRQTSRKDRVTESVRGYLFGIARHLVMKRLAGRHEVPLVEPETLEHTGEANALNVLDDLVTAETVDAVRRAVESLSSDYREVVVLCDLQELDYEAAAGVMQCPVGTVRSRLHRARMLLARKLTGLREQSGGGER